MILVAGGTGRLGSELVNRLSARGVRVRVLTRDPRRAAHLVSNTVDVAVGDVRDAATLEAAMRDVTVVVSAVHGFAGPGRVTPQSVDRIGNSHLVDAAAGAGADVILMSVVGAAADSPMVLLRAKYAAEEHLRVRAPAWTIVRATAFAELWADIMKKPIVFGRGDNPLNFVAVADVAALAERAVVDSGLRGRVLEIGGPENLTFNEFAATLQEIRGAPGRVRHIPRPVLRVLAPVARQPRAALVMDTTPMTFDRAAAGLPGDIPATDVRTALTRHERDRQTA